MLVGVLCWRLLGSHRFYIDLEVYRFGVQTLWNGGDLYGPMPPTSAGIALPFIYPPFSTVVFAPFTLVPKGIAVIAALVLSLVAIAVTLHLVFGRVLPEAVLPEKAMRRRTTLTALVLPLTLALEPVRATIEFGQVNLWLMGLVAVDCLARKPRWPRGMLIGIAAAIKVTPGGFILFFLLRKDFRAAVTTVVTIVATAAIGFVVAPAASVRYWSDIVLGASGLSGSAFATNQTIAGELSRLEAGPVLTAAVWCVLLPAVLAALVVVIRRVGPAQALVANAGGVLVLSPISWSHHWVWIVPALVVLVAQARSCLALVPVFVVGPHSLLPAGGHREATWTWWQHLVGNAYLLIALLALFWTAARLSPCSSRRRSTLG
ncbi:glycosyltransferase 87 family protein [Allokutzneria sp. A3M-2-11 16]|uniref:glycosyltransferase 87 family protein n=1 Tax=Allokutzneria sp. A3M-2-11 16 TaxID=2962043 RepID=UPI0020B8DB94|nr:glycosyltransferase 87 family protein [Allokutzneria sp. A3M-2-11 16]MCP3798342.1 glycosyltransferase 87 family protein [Allokutzneria sp. A3M-2-11 16]